MSHHDEAVAAAPPLAAPESEWLAWVERWYPWSVTAERALMTRYRADEEPQRPEHLQDLAGIRERAWAAAMARCFFAIRHRREEWRQERQRKVAAGVPQSFHETRTDLFDAIDGDGGWG